MHIAATRTFLPADWRVSAFCAAMHRQRRKLLSVDTGPVHVRVAVDIDGHGLAGELARIRASRAARVHPSAETGALTRGQGYGCRRGANACDRTLWSWLRGLHLPGCLRRREPRCFVRRKPRLGVD